MLWQYRSDECYNINITWNRVFHLSFYFVNNHVLIDFCFWITCIFVKFFYEFYSLRPSAVQAFETPTRYGGKETWKNAQYNDMIPQTSLWHLREHLENKGGQGRHSGVNDNVLEALMGSNPRTTVLEMTKGLVVSKSTVVNHLERICKMAAAWIEQKLDVFALELVLAIKATRFSTTSQCVMKSGSYTKTVPVQLSSWTIWNFIQFNGLDWSLLVKHLDYEDIHNSWLYCFTNPLEIGTRVSLSYRQPWRIWEKKVHRGKQ